jgi:hypothetical protein
MVNHHDWYAFFEKAGVQIDSVVDLNDVSGPRHVRYLDLIRSNDTDEPLPDAVVESSGVPLVYVVRHDTSLPAALMRVIWPCSSLARSLSTRS